MHTVIALAVTVAASAPPAAAEQQARSTVRAPARTPRSTLKRVTADPAAQTPEQTLAEELRAIWAGRALRRGTTAVYVVNARTGEPLFAAHEDRALNPASNVKLVSTATALHVLGPEWTYVTQLLGPQPDADGIIHGDVYLYGNADPTLATRHLETFAVDLLAAGVRRIDGSVLLSDHPLRDGVAQPRVLVTVTGTDDGEPPDVTVTPPMPNVQIEVQAVTSKRRRRTRLHVSTRRVQDDEGDKLVVRVAGRIRPGRTGRYRRKVPSASLFTGHALRGAMVEAGIEVRGGVRLAALDAYVADASAAGYLPVELTRHESLPVKDLVARINKPSNNFLADRLLMTVGAVRFGGQPSLERGVEAMREWMRRDAGLDASSIVLDTGSGLSYQSRISPKQIVQVLRVASGYIEQDAPRSPTASLNVAIDHDQAPVYSGSVDDDEIERVFLDSLAVAGVDGTLRRRYKKSALKGLMIGKTGTLTRVIALSGFVSWEDEDPIVFAFVTNGHRHRRRNTVRYEHAKMARAILDYMRQRHARAESADVAPVAASAPAESEAAPTPAAQAAGDETDAETDETDAETDETDAETDEPPADEPPPDEQPEATTPRLPPAPPASPESTSPPA